MRIFLRVVEAGSFSSAGRQLGLAPSSVSRKVNDLEDDLGVRLFQRTTRKLSLTEAGQIYYEQAERIVNDIDEVRLAVSQLDGTATGILRLSVPVSLSRRQVIPAVVEFQRQYPGVEVVLNASDQVLDMIEHRIDLTIRLGALKDSSLVARRIGTGKRYCCASPAYLEEFGEPGHPGELAAHNCLTFRANPGANLWQFKGGKDRINVRVSGNFYANDGESLVAAAVLNHGIILVPHWLVGAELDSGALQQILPAYKVIPGETPLYALYPLQRHLPAKVRAFIDFMVARNEVGS
jgi:DNA-binding transcriptional LysR family regulator